MADAQDFIPTEAKIEVNPAYIIDEVKNFASDEDIVGQIRGTVDEYENRFVSQRSEWMDEDDGIWNLCDWAFRSCINDTATETQKATGANKPAGDSERAKVGTTQFYRQVTQMAANGYAVQTSKDVPFKYESLNGDSVDTADADKARTKNLNLLAKWSMKRDNFNVKSIDFWTQIKKYGNIPVMVEWKRRSGRKIIREPIFSETEPGVVESYDLREVDTVLENRPVWTVLPIESVKADSTIGNIQRQECVIVSSVVGMSTIVDGIKTGLYRDDILVEFSRSHQWDGYTGFENSDDKKDNRLMDGEPTNTGTGQYLKREIFVNVPIDEEEGKWDAMEYVPLRYRVTMFGNDPHDSVVARIERNQEPDDTIPIEMIHANPDDPDLLYHISNFEVIRSNISVETTLLRQSIDNNTLVNNPMTYEVNGEITGNDREFKPDGRIFVDNPNSFGMYNVRDVSQTTIGLLEYMKEDSNTANSIDKNMIGESFGARTSASEAGTIAGNSRRPNLVNIEYVLNQLFGFVAQRYKILWETYGLRNQIIQITDEEERVVRINPTDLGGEYDIVIDIVDDIKDAADAAQKMVQYTQAIMNTPMAQTVDWVDFNKVLSENMLGTSKFVRAGNEGDAEDNALRNVSIMLQGGQIQLTDQMNLKKHLEIYKQARTQWNGAEEQNPNIAILDAAIAQVEQRIAQPPPAQPQGAGGVGGQQGAPQAPVGA